MIFGQRQKGKKPFTRNKPWAGPDPLALRLSDPKLFLLPCRDSHVAPKCTFGKGSKWASTLAKKTGWLRGDDTKAQLISLSPKRERCSLGFKTRPPGAAATVAQTGTTLGTSFYEASFLLCIIWGGVWTQTIRLLAARRGHTSTITTTINTHHLFTLLPE